MISVDIVDRLLNDQPDDRQMQREARCVLYGLLKEAGEEIIELRAVQIVDEINRRFAARDDWALDTQDQLRPIEAQLPPLKAADGFIVSVQASEYHYCSPRKPWETLREAADILDRDGFDGFDCRALANQLESAAAPKPPTLAEALKNCLDELYSIHSQYGCKENAREHSAAIRQAEEALARAENGA